MDIFVASPWGAGMQTNKCAQTFTFDAFVDASLDPSSTLKWKKSHGFKGEADDIVCLVSDPGLYAVGQLYVDFEPVTTAEAKRLLERRGTPIDERPHST